VKISIKLLVDDPFAEIVYTSLTFGPTVARPHCACHVPDMPVQLHWLDVPDSSDSSPVSERPRTTVSVGALHPGLQCRHAPASAFRQPSPTCRTAFLAQHLRPSGVLGCWPDGLELPDFIRDPTSSTDCFRRLLKTYLFARY